MPNPYTIETQKDISDYNDKRIKYAFHKDGEFISGSGVLKCNVGIISGKIKSHIEVIEIDRYEGFGKTIYLKQNEFDRITLYESGEMVLNDAK